MPIVKAPTYSKVPNPKSGIADPCYTFVVEFEKDEPRISFVTEDSPDISLQALQKQVLNHLDWWNGFITTFLQASAKYFSKPYTVEQINKISKHTLQGTPPTETPAHVHLTPLHIQISGGVFLIHWQYICEPMIIDIPVMEEPVMNEVIALPVMRQVEDGIEELTMDDVPVDKNATEGTFVLESPAKFYDKQKVKEARLKAKLAVYKAQHQMSKYYDKYGHELSDSDSETEDLSEEEEEEEEVQL